MPTWRASAALNYDVEVIEFLEILAKISVRERNILERMIGAQGLGKWDDREARAVAGLGFEIRNSQAAVSREADLRSRGRPSISPVTLKGVGRSVIIKSLEFWEAVWRHVSCVGCQ